MLLQVDSCEQFQLNHWSQTVGEIRAWVEAGFEGFLMFSLVLFLADFHCCLMITNEVSERRTVTLAWVNTSLCKEKLEVMISSEKMSCQNSRNVEKEKRISC